MSIYSHTLHYRRSIHVACRHPRLWFLDHLCCRHPRLLSLRRQHHRHPRVPLCRLRPCRRCHGRAPVARTQRLALGSVSKHVQCTISLAWLHVAFGAAMSARAVCRCARRHPHHPCHYFHRLARHLHLPQVHHQCHHLCCRSRPCHVRALAARMQRPALGSVSMHAQCTILLAWSLVAFGAAMSARAIRRCARHRHPHHPYRYLHRLRHRLHLRQVHPQRRHCFQVTSLGRMSLAAFLTWW